MGLFNRKPRHQHTWKLVSAVNGSRSVPVTLLSYICTECKKTATREVDGWFSVQDFD